MPLPDPSTLKETLPWFRRAWDWSLQLLHLRGDVAQLKSAVEKLDASKPPRPRDLRLVHGIYWGRLGDDPKVHPFCAACAAKSVYVPLSREDHYANGEPRRDGAIIFDCPNCHWRDTRRIEQEREALGN